MKRIVSIIAIISMISIMSIAYAESSNNLEPIEIAQGTEGNYSSYTVLWSIKNVNNHNRDYQVRAASNTSSVYCAYAEGYFVFVTKQYNANIYIVNNYYPDSNSGQGESIIASNIYINDEYYYVYYQRGIGNSQTDIDGLQVAMYQSRSEALEEMTQYITDNGGGGDTNTTYSLNYSLPAGNIAYIEFNEDFDEFTLKTTMPTTSYIVGTSLWDTTQTYGFTSSLPISNITPPSDKVPWARDGALAVTGVTNKAIFEYGPHHPTSGNYLVICNPAYYGGTANGPYEFLNNGSINIQADNVLGITVYQLNSNLAPIPGSNDRLDITTTGTGIVYQPEFDPETGELVWPDNQEPTVGGGNLTVSSEDGFKSFLGNLVEKIKGIFEPAHDAIQTLASAVSNFASTLRALYIWLPSPVLSILTSAITLAIVIGIIKVFI